MAFIYTLFRIPTYIALHLYFKRIVFINKERIPKKEGVIFIMNHPNAFLDALVLILHTWKPIYPLAQAGLYNNPIMKVVYNTFRMMPIYRQRDGHGSVEKNQAIFKRSGELMFKGNSILVYAEGNPSVEFGLLPLKKGAARMGYQFQETRGVPTTFVPVGINYGNRHKGRAEVVVSIGEPFQTNPEGTGTREELEAITKKMDQAMKENLIYRGSDEQPGTVKRMKAENHRLGKATIQAQFKRLQEMASGVLQGKELPAAENEMFSAYRSSGSWLMYLLLLIPGLAGSILYYPAALGVRMFGENFPKDEQFIASLKIVAIMILAPLYTWILSGLLAWGTESSTMMWFVCLVFLGWLGLKWQDEHRVMVRQGRA
jgi:1-acyl-sn-glycerol-3-phosphate acyltransferase